MLFAGSYAQALASRRSLWQTFRYSGKLDLKEAVPAVGWCTTVMCAAEWRHCGTCTLLRAFLQLRWDAIERVASGLLKEGRLSARRVRALARI